jgi:hypothetical protein
MTSSELLASEPIMIASGTRNSSNFVVKVFPPEDTYPLKKKY